MAAQETGQRFHWHYNELDDKNFQPHGSGSIIIAIVLFFVLLFLVLLCLYLRRKYRRRRQEAANPPTVHGVVSMAGGGLDQAAIDALPVVAVNSAEDESECSICLCNVATGQKVKSLPNCKHRFHPQCLDLWLKEHSNCPICRASLLSTSGPLAENPV